MIISEKKPIEDILEYLKDSQKVIITGCSLCASTCKVGGEDEVAEMKDTLEKNGKKVLGYKVLDPSCNLLKTRKDLKSLKDELKDADAIVSLACGDGTQTVAKLVDIPVYPGNNTLFIGEVERVGQYSEACKACGDCQLGWTGGICPVTMCAKGLLNGPCGGARDGKCEVNPDNDCAWILIYNKLKELGQLDNLDKIRDPRNYQINSHPKKINLRAK
ncbi:methylenetetrahydrofolate reductase C-terminal domain-containing protein [Clostridium luticellarii]|jgi:ferredoxin|uniref:Methylene-tetrahydrofolate reductase C-terminal-like domain-containing protein n=1 Tax=Clostridium luticellarii TaxID=1691940 RepID=A0A2T0BT01_9CLOT|nr:methylenetetrahydrofolate reductase C-terminal domain-containing protein [Clostridium luticellarii]MCI1946191.1 methylenetetrahydrofolate reductase C-terminal domain-containing protein [Clostridium luticellarii]MCI1969492.1 methylenetetrahydrofolate reductase C-terminal domain-containing protein [Clostridium luticellarii]MCI1995449.1 methylenetetrahydrofolate reductase C-terminal domain-containing protein [Clostridium luticellarii]MCI2040639.1 methylenetetrahydrofolate reductase C-terminal d